ncbi:MAG: hypothetical protein ACRDKY_01430, partial [Solirubrobacteraceae bacterium]
MLELRDQVAVARVRAEALRCLLGVPAQPADLRDAVRREDEGRVAGGICDAAAQIALAPPVG